MKAFTEHNNSIRTFSGHTLSLINPYLEHIELIDIAKGLAYKSHFGGQTPKYFSIAEHSILVHDLMKIMEPVENETACLRESQRVNVVFTTKGFCKIVDSEL